MSRRGFYKEGTQESIRETERFLQHREAITELDIHGEEIDIRTVTVTSEDKGGPRGDPPRCWTDMAHVGGNGKHHARWESLDNTLCPDR